MAVGQVVQMQALVRSALGTLLYRDVRWSVSDSDVASVHTDSGMLTAFQPGPVTVVAESEGQRGSTDLVVPRGGLGGITISTATTGEDLDPDGYFVGIDAMRDPYSRRTRIGLNQTITLWDPPVGSLAIWLADVAPNCALRDNPVTVSVPAGGDETVAFAIACTARQAGSGDRLAGTWQAVEWSFFPDSTLTKPYEDVVAGGRAGRLTVQWNSDGTYRWEWLETYRWWGPDRPTLFGGSAVLQGDLLYAEPDRFAGEFECWWGDCDGPLHGPLAGDGSV